MGGYISQACLPLSHACCCTCSCGSDGVGCSFWLPSRRTGSRSSFLNHAVLSASSSHDATSPAKPVVIIGGCAGAKTACETFRASGVLVHGLMSNYTDDWSCVLDPPIDLGDWNLPRNLELLSSGRVGCFVAAGDSELRRSITKEIKEAVVKQLVKTKAPAVDDVLELKTCVHPTVALAPSASVGRGTYVGPMAVINTGTRLGDGVRLESATVVEHDSVLEPYVNGGPGVRLCGYVVVKEGAFLGTGCLVSPGVVIGRNAVIGAGAVVLSDVPADTFVAGVPASPKKRRSGGQKSAATCAKHGRQAGGNADADEDL